MHPLWRAYEQAQAVDIHEANTDAAGILEPEEWAEDWRAFYVPTLLLADEVGLERWLMATGPIAMHSAERMAAIRDWLNEGGQLEDSPLIVRLTPWPVDRRDTKPVELLDGWHRLAVATERQIVFVPVVAAAFFPSDY